jgi:hypothetical protein
LSSNAQLSTCNAQLATHFKNAQLATLNSQPIYAFTLLRPKICFGGAVIVKHQPSRLQEILDTIEALPIEEQAMLVEILRHRLREYRRSQLIAEVKEARTAYQHGEAHRGTVEDLMRELEE